jgi:hypothetical protein
MAAKTARKRRPAQHSTLPSARTRALVLIVVIALVVAVAIGVSVASIGR